MLRDKGQTGFEVRSDYLVSLIGSFLSERKTSYEKSDETTETTDVFCGVPRRGRFSARSSGISLTIASSFGPSSRRLLVDLLRG